MKIAGKIFPIWLVIAYVLAVGSILAWPCVAFGSAFAFDDPAAANNPSTYTFVGIVLAYPVLPVAGVLGSYFAFRSERRRLAYSLAGLALIPFVLIALGVCSTLIMNVLAALGPGIQTTRP